MLAALPRRGGIAPLRLPSWPWRITWAYLSLVLFLPLAGMLLKAAGVGPAGFWEKATSPVALASYRVSFGLAALAGLVNGVFGLLIAWALIRCRFPGQKLLDSLIDLPFALPTAVAGLALAYVYSPEGWLGAPLLQTFGLRVSYTAVGVAVAMVFISLPSWCARWNRSCARWRRSRRRHRGAWGPASGRRFSASCCPSCCRRSWRAWRRATAVRLVNTDRW